MIVNNIIIIKIIRNENNRITRTVTWKGLLTGTVLDAVAELNEKILNILHNKESRGEMI